MVAVTASPGLMGRLRALAGQPGPAAALLEPGEVA
jgi:hypothetical protein